MFPERDQYITSRRIWRERNAFNEKLLKVSRYFSYGCYLVCLGSVIALIAMSNAYQRVPYIIETFQGEVVSSYLPASEPKPLPPTAVEHEIKAFIRALRENPADSTIKGRGLSKLNAMTIPGTDAYEVAIEAYTEYITTFQVAGGVVGSFVSIDFLEARRLAEGVWFVSWKEWLVGEPDDVSVYTATVSYVRRPISEQNLRANPFGVYVVSIDLGERE